MSEEIAKKMCLDKKRYPSLIKVFAAIGRIKALFPNAPEPRHYPCPICLGFHITTKPKRQDQIKAELAAIQLFTRKEA